MSDVARWAGVSGSTVSHVLNGTRHVNEETRQRVEEAILATGYRQNSLARSLAAGRTKTVGISIPILTNPYIGSLVNAIEGAASAAGYTVLLGDSRDDAETEARSLNTFLERRVDGILMAPGVDSYKTTIPQILAGGTPLILIDRPVNGVACDQIFAENFESARQLTLHLINEGYQDIAVVRGTPGIGSTDDRYRGFLAALEDAGRPNASRLAVMGHANTQLSEKVLTKLFSGPSRPDALVSLNNAMTIGAMRAFRELGLDVPKDVALVSFDDFEWADLFSPRLTAMAQDVGEMGRRAIELLMSRIDEPGRPPEVVGLPTHFEHRDSCGCTMRAQTAALAG
ncbi:LacI family DNA-binding transcriptional regulator [bacterium RCC_150]